jgi:high-affinity iron transporter
MVMESHFSVAIQSGTILLREGLEAMLIIAALAAFLVRMKALKHLKALYAGAGIGILASLAAAAVFVAYFNGAHNDRLEAIVMIIAAGLMLYVSGWLFLRQNPRAWKAELERSAERALASKASLPIAAISFLAVFREGAETILFMHALAMTSGGWGIALVSGLGVASLLLAVLFIAMQWLAVRLPLRPMFIATSAFLFVMGLKFVGGAIQELQEQALISYNDAPVPGILVSLGLNPTWEALLSQLIIALLAIISTLAFYYTRLKSQTIE